MKDAPLSTPEQQAKFLHEGYAKPAKLAAGGPEPIKVGQTSAAKPAPQRTGNDEHMTKFMESAERVLKRWAGVADAAQPAPAPAPTPKPEPLTLDAVRAGVSAHQKALRSAKNGTERSAALEQARAFTNQVVEFAGDVANLDVASEAAFSLNPLTVEMDHHAEQTALAEL